MQCLYLQEKWIFSDIVINSAVSVAIVDSETIEIWKFKTFIYKSDKIVS